MSKYFMVAKRPGPNHRWFKHPDYGDNAALAYDVKMVGPHSGGVLEGDEYSIMKAWRNEGYDLIVTELPSEWPEPLFTARESKGTPGTFVVLKKDIGVAYDLPEQIAHGLADALNEDWESKK